MSLHDPLRVHAGGPIDLAAMADHEEQDLIVNAEAASPIGSPGLLSRRGSRRRCDAWESLSRTPAIAAPLMVGAIGTLEALSHHGIHWCKARAICAKTAGSITSVGRHDATVRAQGRDPGLPVAVRSGSGDRRARLSQPSPGPAGGRRHHRDHDQCARLGGPRAELRGAAPGARADQGDAGRSGRDRGRRVHQRQPRGGADRAHGAGRGRRLPAGLPARHDGVGRAHAARDGPRAFFAHHRCERPADHPVPVSARLAADVPLADLAGALPALSPDPRDQGFLRRRQAARAPHPRARRARSAGERAEHAQRLADELAWCSAATACCRAPAA